MSFPLIFPLSPVIIALFTIFPCPLIITVSEEISRLFVKSFDVIWISPVPVVFPLFVMFLPEIINLCCPWRFPSKLISCVVVNTVLLALIVPVLSNFWAFCIDISPDSISPVFVIFELSSKILLLDAILPLLITSAFAEFTSFTAKISPAFVSFWVSRSTSLLEWICPLFVDSFTLALTLPALILPAFLNSNPLTSTFFPSIFPPLWFTSESVAEISELVATVPEFSNLLDEILSPDAIFPEFFTFLAVNLPFVSILPPLSTSSAEIFPDAKTFPVFVTFFDLKSLVLIFPEFFTLSVLIFSAWTSPEFSVFFPDKLPFAKTFPLFLISFETAISLPVSTFPLFSRFPLTVIFPFDLTSPEVSKSSVEILPTAAISFVFFTFFALKLLAAMILPLFETLSTWIFFPETFPDDTIFLAVKSSFVDISPVFFTSFVTVILLTEATDPLLFNFPEICVVFETWIFPEFVKSFVFKFPFANISESFSTSAFKLILPLACVWPANFTVFAVILISLSELAISDCE